MAYAMAHCCITSTSLTLCVAFGILQVREELKKVIEKLKAAEIALENKVQKSANFTIVAFFSAVSVHGFFGHLCAALKAVFGVLQSYSWKCMQNLEVKKINDEKKTALAAQFAAEATLRRVHAAQKDEDLPPIEAILAPLEAELRLTYKEVMCLAVCVLGKMLAEIFSRIMIWSMKLLHGCGKHFTPHQISSSDGYCHGR
jgi:hypothetical protein